MKFTETKGDLFTAPQGYYLAHCISGNYALGAGIAKEFDRRYNMRYKLHKNYPIPVDRKTANIGSALLIDNVFNLVTKGMHYEKPDYDVLYDALCDMREQCESKDITNIAMPRIGCGLDKLDWDNVSDLINDIFEDTDINILVFTL